MERSQNKNSKQQRYNEILQGAKPMKNIETKVITTVKLRSL